MPCQFVFNVDDTGPSDFGDKWETMVVIPSTDEARLARIPADRHGKRSILTACLAADGYRTRPFVNV
jgi:hypothetical protein